MPRPSANRCSSQPTVIVGHSLGGGTAAGLAQTAPELVRGVVLEDPAIMAPDASSAADALEGNALLDGFRLLRESVPQMQAAGMSATDLVAMLRERRARRVCRSAR